MKKLVSLALAVLCLALAALPVCADIAPEPYEEITSNPMPFVIVCVCAVLVIAAVIVIWAVVRKCRK